MRFRRKGGEKQQRSRELEQQAQALEPQLHAGIAELGRAKVQLRTVLIEEMIGRRGRHNESF